MPDYVPLTDDGLLLWAEPLSEKLTLSPELYGITAAIATLLATKLAAFKAALAAVKDQSTRGPAATLLKSETRADLVKYIRQVVRQVQGTMTVTDVQRQALGIPIHDTEASPIGVPAMSPGIIVENVSGFYADLKFFDPTNPTKRGRPAGVQGLSIFSHLGEEIPANIADWKFESSTTLMRGRIVFDETTPAGAKAFVTAFFYNPRGQSGLAANPVQVIVQGGGLTQAA